MKNKWSDEEAARCLLKYAEQRGEDLALRVYLAVLIGAEPDLVLHGGGNASVKTTRRNIFGELMPAIYVKASGRDMAQIEPDGFIPLDLEHLNKLRVLESLSEEQMLDELHRHRLDSRSSSPSVESLFHVFLPHKYIDHTHADAILALTNQPDGKEIAQEALGPDVLVLEYVEPGFKLARAAAAAYEASPQTRAMAWMRHGLVTWGVTARESYEVLIEIISRAETFVAQKARRPLVVQVSTPVSTAEERFSRLGPMVRGLLARPTGDPDRPHARSILQLLADREVLDFLDSDRGKELAVSAPLTCDHLIRTKPYPLWIDNPQFDDPEAFRNQAARAIADYASAYNEYFERNSARMPAGVMRFDPLPRVLLLPGLGAVCSGGDVRCAQIVKDITAHTLAVKAQIAAMGSYSGIAEVDLFDMEYRGMQHAKLGRDTDRPLAHQVALITGAAGAIGSAIAEELLAQGCHVAVTDLPGDPLHALYHELQEQFGPHVTAVPLDVTDPASVTAAFGAAVRTWGGVDLVVVNAGLAMVSGLEEMNLESFRRLERVNVEGTLLVLGEAARHFRMQRTGGDIVAISTKNVFAPGAKFGAYSATKSAAHQLVRIASLELADIDVRVNMVSPDAVFTHKGRQSGLWAQVGPSRMAARGLDPEGLQEYYRSRNLLKARVTAQHVAKAVLFFATRQTPTTGATLPVDGGLPDATPR